MLASCSAFRYALNTPMQISVQRTNAVVATREFQSSFAHLDDEGFQLVFGRLGGVEPCERLSIPFDCSQTDVADELMFSNELLNCSVIVLSKAGGVWRGQKT
jgi:hypothetical protein